MSKSIGDILRKPKQTDDKKAKTDTDDKDNKKPKGNAMLAYIANCKNQAKEK